MVTLNFDKVTGNRTYNYPNWNGDVIISTTGGPNPDTRFNKVIADEQLV